MSAALRKTIKYWEYLLPYTHVPRNESEYEELLAIVDELMAISRYEKDESITTFLNFLAKNIALYEAHRYPTKTPTPIEMLEFLMEEHDLTQSDLPEIGSQSLVSKILNGERQLTVEHIQHLAKRFGVSPAVFIQ